MQIMISKLRRAAGIGLILSGISQPFVKAQGQCEPDALANAQKFIRAQFNGASIGGSPDALKESRSLVIEDGEPPPAPIVFVESYSIKDTEAVGQECRVTIVYERLGTISPEKLVFRLVKSEEIANIWLARDSGIWKVHMDTKHYGIPPHVGKEAIRHWLRLFLTPPRDEKTAKAEQLLQVITRY